VRLQQLLQDIPLQKPRQDAELLGLTSDSRQVEPGFLFVATRGRTTDGHAFLAEASRRGAAALAGEAPDPRLGLPYLQVSDSRWFLAEAASVWHGRPSRSLVVIGVTGTDGKTTTCNLLHAMLERAGHPTGLITSVNAVIGDRTLDTGFHVTTPDAPDIQRYLAEMVRAGLTHVVLEATSHGLAQQRVAACDFDLAVVTNVTPEHLDYHGTFEAYLSAKARLLESLGETPPKKGVAERLAILNRDDLSFDALRARTPVRSVSYGLGPGADITARDVRLNADGIRFQAVGPGFGVEVESRLPGVYNVANCLAALACATLGLGIDPAMVAESIRTAPAIPGRMEPVDIGQGFQALVDFAHTPNALRQALLGARARTRGSLIVVFGCAGLRDRSKRAVMAATAVELADLSVFTAEDPRTESLEAILEEMAAGALRGGGVEGITFRRIPDRGEALRWAVANARPGDLVLACGKGHERSMAFGAVEHPWDDRVAMRAALAERMGVAGPAMPKLPTGG
jgi:UDP-N-acetylmuramoyl-L-alanyl-D-glutamate--2,6-diaminopimelate ligase